MTTASVIGPGTVVHGSVRGEGDLEIQGRVEGSVIVSGEVIVAETALVKSDIRARRVIVRGAVRGNVSADELLILDAGARVLGDLGAPQVGIRPGGLVKGHVSTAGPLPLEKPKPAPVAKAAPAPAARAATPAHTHAPAPAARQAPPPPRLAPMPARVVPAPRPSSPHVTEHEPAVVARATPRAPVAVVHEEEPESPPADPPPPVVPAMPKGARAQVRKKSGK